MLRDQWSAEETETRVDVRYDQRRHISDRNRPCLVPGQRIEVEVPIQGETELMYARASTSNFSPPRAGISGGSLRIVIEIPHDDADRNPRGEIDKTLADVDEHLSWIRNDLASFNASLPGAADQAVNGRRQLVLGNQGRAASLGIPLKNRDGAPTTYAVPDIRRKVMPKLFVVARH